MIKRETIKNLRFLDGTFFGEDLNFSAKLIYNAKKIVKLNKALYFYRREDNGSSKNYFKFTIDYVRVYDDMILYFSDKMDKNFLDKMWLRRFRKIFLPSVFQFAVISKNSKSYEEFLKFMRKMSVDLMQNPLFKQIKPKYRLYFWLIKNIKSDFWLVFILKILTRFNNFFARRVIRDFE